MVLSGISERLRISAIVGSTSSILNFCSVKVNLSLSSPEEYIIVSKGDFYQESSGRWVYLISEDVKSASRQDKRLGCQNPRYVEIVEGLKKGDGIITSGYDTFKEAEVLIF